MYGIDVDDEALMSARSWRWLRMRVVGLMSRPSSMFAYTAGETTRIAVVPTTRVGFALNPPTFEPTREG